MSSTSIQPKKKYPSETKEQINLIAWAKKQKDVFEYLIAIPNGGYRFNTNAAVLKKCGVKAGVSDLFFTKACGGYNGLWIELKSVRFLDTKKPLENREKHLSDNQKKWFDRMRAVGYKCCIAFGFEEAKDSLLNYIKQDIRIPVNAAISLPQINTITMSTSKYHE